MIATATAVTLHNIHTVVWDLDGTLLDSFGIHVDIMLRIMPRYGLPIPTAEEFEKHFHGRLEDSLRGLAGGASEETLASLLKDFLRIDNDYIKDVNHHLFIDAVGLVKRAHAAGARQIIVSNRMHGTDRGKASPRTMVAHSILRPYIDDILCGDEVIHHKPDSRVLDGLAQKPASDEGMLVVGDQFVDAQLALNLRGTAILVNRQTNAIAHVEKLSGTIENVRVVRSLRDVSLLPSPRYTSKA